MNFYLETNLQYFSVFLAWCKLHPKFLSTFLLFILTFLIVIIALSTDIPDEISSNQHELTSINNKFIDFYLNATQLEWVTSNCGYYACIDDLCYCYTRYPMTWETASKNCRNSGLPNAGLIKPLEPNQGGVFETNRNVFQFLKSLPHVGPLWSGLSRINESDDFRDESEKTYNWFQSYKRSGETGRIEENCVHKLTSNGFAVADCFNRDLLPLSPEYFQLVIDQRYDQYFQWNDRNSARDAPQLSIKVKILCESEWRSLSDEEKKCVRENVTKKFYMWGDSVYYTKENFQIWGSDEQKRVCQRTSCYYDPYGHRAVINSKEEEKLILEEIDDIILEIGMQYSVETGDFIWENNSNGLPIDQLKWNYEEQKVTGLKCLASESLSDSDLQLNWVAQRCSQNRMTICTFTPPQLGKNEPKTLISVTSDGMRNPYKGYFCLDKQRTSCYILLNKSFLGARHFIRENNLRVAVVKDKDKKEKIAMHLRPHNGAFVAATALRRGDKYEWMYEDKNNLVEFDHNYELLGAEIALENPSSKKYCLILASIGYFAPSNCNSDLYLTLIDVSNDTTLNFMSIRKYAHF